MQTNNLNYATPESLGIPSHAVESFLEVLKAKNLSMHSFMLIRHGKVAAEGYWPPFDEHRKQRMYSISKSFTSVAIGMMIGEGKLSLDSKVADFFPEYLPENPHRYVLEATVRDLLMMATFNESTSSSDTNFTEAFFMDQRPKHKPGQVFSYDTSATNVLCAIVEKLSEKPLLEYMRPVLDEIGFSKDAWCVQTPEGRSWTGSGVICTTRDLARFALLCINMGQWDGKQLVNQEYMQAATSRQIDNSVTTDWADACFGYGYQFWCMKDGGFAMYGMGSQFALCMPKYDAILVTTADTQGVADALEIIFDTYANLLKTFSPEALPENNLAYGKLKERIAGLSIPLPKGQMDTPLAEKIFGRKYTLEENQAGIKWLCLLEESGKYRLQYENNSGEHELVFGIGRYEAQLFPEKYFGLRIGVKDTNYQCIGAAAWADDKTLLCTLYSVDVYMGSIKIQLTFEDSEVCGCMVKAAEWFFDEYQGFISGKAGD